MKNFINNGRKVEIKQGQLLKNPNLRIKIKAYSILFAEISQLN
jgi:hypothetical protein